MVAAGIWIAVYLLELHFPTLRDSNQSAALCLFYTMLKVSSELAACNMPEGEGSDQRKSYPGSWRLKDI